MTYAKLFLKYPRYLSYGLLHSFFSGFGQTFFIALFVPYFKDGFDLTSADFGMMYSQATLVSAFLIPLIGPFIDNTNLKSFSYFTGLGIMVGCLILGSADSIVTLFIGLSVVRLMGQGMMSHITVTAISRFFDKTRGRALSVSQLGFPISEALWPIIVTSIISVFGWRAGFYSMSVLIVVVFFPLSYFLIGSHEVFSSGVLQKSTKKIKSSFLALWTETNLLKTSYFYMILPFSLLPPFLLTGVFISQSDIADLKGWSMATMASSFIGFAIFRLVFSFVVGPLVDKFTARRVLPFTLVPHILGFLVMLYIDSVWAPFLMFTLYGFGVGAGMNIKAALWPELYGTEHLGKIRSFITPLGVLATAVGPWAFGWYFSHREGLTELVQWSVGAMVAATLLVLVARPPRTNSEAAV